MRLCELCDDKTEYRCCLRGCAADRGGGRGCIARSRSAVAVAALKNDVMNLLRNQDPPAEGLVETLVAMLDGNNMGKDNFNSSGATAPDLENAAEFRGENKKVVFTSCSSCFPLQHPPVVLDYCIQNATRSDMVATVDYHSSGSL